MQNKVDTVSQAHCLRCGRKLTALASVAAGYGPVCRARIAAAALISKALDGFTDKQRDQVAELISDAGIVPTSRPGVFRTVSSRGDVTYLTHSAACNCPAGLRGRACYHTAAARLLNASRKAA